VHPGGLLDPLARLVGGVRAGEVDAEHPAGQQARPSRDDDDRDEVAREQSTVIASS
jgi:hypothetical protein